MHAHFQPRQFKGFRRTGFDLYIVLRHDVLSRFPRGFHQKLMKTKLTHLSNYSIKFRLARIQKITQYSIYVKKKESSRKGYISGMASESNISEKMDEVKITSETAGDVKFQFVFVLFLSESKNE